MDGDAHRETLATASAVGVHWLVDCHGVDAAKLASADFLRCALREAAGAAGATILFDHFHDFGGTAGAAAGVTGVVLLAESHATIHTWPATGFAAIDLFLCGPTEPERAIASIESSLVPVRMAVRREARGV